MHRAFLPAPSLAPTATPTATPAEPIDRPRIGLALGGGSARGYAHIGVLESLERGGVSPDVVVGTSFGAVVGALWAAGKSPSAMRLDAERLRRRDVFPHIVDIGVGRGALLAGDRLEAYFDRLLEGRHFADLSRSFAVVATDLDSGCRVVFREGPLAPVLRASASLPGLFAPAHIGGRRLIDGGIGTPVPLDTLADFDVDIALGIGVGVDVVDSRALRVARRALRSRAGRATRGMFRVRPGAAPRASGSWEGLGRAVALTVDAWSVDGVVAPERSGRLHVQTRPPISWLRFDRAGLAIAAGDAAMEVAWPRLRIALAGARAGSSSGPAPTKSVVAPLLLP
ncbi:MAG: patatin-like phospholipase family protein [Trueperaceae bacterium]|nr:patatin-like phospholipase family protein [Trueperaceae bacterium]